MIEEARRMKREGVERYEWQWNDTRQKFIFCKQKQMAKQSEASTAITQKVYREAPPEHRFEASTQRFLTYEEMIAELQENTN